MLRGSKQLVIKKTHHSSDAQTCKSNMNGQMGIFTSRTDMVYKLL